MDCQEFLARYSEYFDEVMDFADAAQMQRHLEACARCMRYDGVMRRGLDLARAMPPIGPSSDFQRRLEHRLLHVRDEMAADGRAPNGSAAVSLALAGLLALAAWGPLLSRGEAPTSAAATMIAAPAAEANARSEAQPTVADDGWWLAPTLAATLAPAFAPAFMPPGRSLSHAFPGPYSPLVVTPPLVNYDGAAGRATLTSYPGID